MSRDWRHNREEAEKCPCYFSRRKEPRSHGIMSESQGRQAGPECHGEGGGAVVREGGWEFEQSLPRRDPGARLAGGEAA